MSERYCIANLNYVQGMVAAAIPVEIIDARKSAPSGSWETHGFELMRHASGITDFDDEMQIADTHYAEISELAQRLTGCEHALVSGHISRNPEQAALHSDLGPIQFVHSDFAPSYGQRIRDFYAEGSERAEAGLASEGLTAADIANAKRMLILQFWRNVGPAHMDLPIAFCDVTSTSADEIIPIPVNDYAGGGFDFEALAIRAPDTTGSHRWYTFPDMQVDEVVAFRTYDTALMSVNAPYWTPHSAFADPSVAPGAPARRSIELRATCIWN